MISLFSEGMRNFLFETECDDVNLKTEHKYYKS